jgi:neurotransmitter:Na+ symporter, NSS family
MTNPRAHFSSSFGFIMVASGSAIGLGNIWGFPTQAANNGGGAFVLAYFALAFLLAYPALMAELIIGRHSNTNIVTALGSLSSHSRLNKLGASFGYLGVATASLILSFYAIVAGWMLAKCLGASASIIGAEQAANWLNQESLGRDISLCLIFSAWTCWIVAQGINKGIESWARKLMPMLLVILLALTAYVLTQAGASQGLRAYLLPDFSRLGDSALLLGAMGQSFFSLSLGVGTMLIYGSYLGKTLAREQSLQKQARDKLPRLGAIVTLMDSGFSFLAGLLVVPALYVAQANGLSIFASDHTLIAGPGIVMQVLPSLFATMGAAGQWVTVAFFALLCIAAITSSVSMLEVPVAVVTEKTSLSRTAATLIMSAIIFAMSLVILLNFDPLFNGVVTLSTRYSEPFMGLVLCLFAGWILHRDKKLMQLRDTHSGLALSWFWRLWPFYARLVCPLFIVLMFIQSLR